jgi:hypothetical protein
VTANFLRIAKHPPPRRAAGSGTRWRECSRQGAEHVQVFLGFRPVSIGGNYGSLNLRQCAEPSWWWDAAMNDNIPVFEIPEWATLDELLALSVEGARELVQLRLGYEVELASLEPIYRSGCINIRVRWRCRQAELASVTAR